MPKINVYLPDDLAAAVREAGLSVSPICQRALAEAVQSVAVAREAIADLRAPEGPDVLPRLQDRMTPSLRRVLARAEGGEPLLAAIAADGQNLAAGILQTFEVDALTEADDPREVLACALEAAIELGHTFLGTEHLLVGLATAPGPARDRLRSRGATPEAIRRAIPAAVAAAQVGYATAGRDLTGRVSAIEARLDAAGL